MSVQSITVEMPVGLYDRLKRRAEQAHRSVEAEVVETVAAAVPTDEELLPDLVAALAQLATVDDATLWQAVRSRFPEEKAAQLEKLHLRRQAIGLSQAEMHQAAALAQEMEKFMFLRAQAMALLMQRGYDLSTLQQRPLHVLCSLPPRVRVITTYQPDPNEWIENRIRRS